MGPIRSGLWRRSGAKVNNSAMAMDREALTTGRAVYSRVNISARAATKGNSASTSRPKAHNRRWCFHHALGQSHTWRYPHKVTEAHRKAAASTAPTRIGTALFMRSNGEV